jgi:hypothetical protein
MVKIHENIFPVFIIINTYVILKSALHGQVIFIPKAITYKKFGRALIITMLEVMYVHAG